MQTQPSKESRTIRPRNHVNIDRSVRGGWKSSEPPPSQSNTNHPLNDPSVDVDQEKNPSNRDIQRPSLTSAGSSFRSPIAKPWYGAEVQRARRHVSKLFKTSVLEDQTSFLPRFTQNECTLGKLLGKGSFGTVHEIKKFAIFQHTANGENTASSGRNDDSLDSDDMEGREFIVRHSKRATGESRYAIKCLNQDIIESRAFYYQGVVNMVIEARILSAVEHPNIIKLRAAAACDMYQQPGFFLILDRLYDTLDKRLTQWQHRSRRLSRLFSVLDRKGKKKESLLEDRLVASFDLSAALDYLHRQGILHRDVKPDNIGFDIRGDIKLFDFSLATELCSEVANSDGTYNLTGMTGSLRYMAPEVALGKPYNATCDVYSFAVMFWEMYALKKPFAFVNGNNFMKLVVHGSTRPLVPKSWPKSVKTMLNRCWSKNLSDRLSMKEISSILKQQIMYLRGGDDEGLEHIRRRSTFVYRQPSCPPTKLPARSVSAKVKSQ